MKNKQGLYYSNKLAAKLADSYNDENKKVVLDLLEENSTAKVLDCGCATGVFTKELGKKIGTSSLFGIELRHGAAHLAQKEGVQVYLADLNKPFPIADESFDVVHANLVMEHLYATDIFIKEIYRVLKKSGYAVIVVPNLASWYSIACLLLGFQPPAASVSEIHLGNPFNPRRGRATAGHLRIFTYSALKELFKYHNFQVDKLLDIGYQPFSQQLSRLLCRIDPRHAAALVVKVRKT